MVLKLIGASVKEGCGAALDPRKHSMRVLIPLPSEGFDPTETSVPWHVLREAGHEVVFLTPDGEPGRADPRMITGRGLLFWSPLLRARADARELYGSMVASPEFQAPRSYAEIGALEGDGLILPGGHAAGVKVYLESEEVRALALRFFAASRPVGAICHGVVVLARTVDPATGRSVLHGRRTTALTRPMEISAWAMTAAWLGRYYRTYPQTVEAEVREACGDPSLFERGPFALRRDGPERLDRGFTVEDGRYLSARWPGDAYRFAHDFVALLEKR